MAQVSCSVQVPTASRSNEGMLFINVEMSTMAAEHFEAGRLGQFGIEINRLVERCIKGTLLAQKDVTLTYNEWYFFIQIPNVLT